MAKSYKETKPIFLDTTGKRKIIVNIISFIFFSIFFGVIAFILYYSYQADKLSIRKPLTFSTRSISENVAMLYTSNDPDAFSITNDKIESVSTILIPQYLVTGQGVQTISEYKTSFEDIQFISKDRPIKNKRFFVLSGINYAIPPTERSKEVTDIKTDSQLYISSVSIPDILKIKADILTYDLDGLFIDLDPISIKTQKEYSDNEKFLSDIQYILEESDLSLGIMISPLNLNEFNSQLFKKIDTVYLKQNSLTTNLKQIEALLKFSHSLPDQIILEVPTISSSVDTSIIEGYNQTLNYKNIQEYLYQYTVTNRDIEPISLTKDNLKYSITDTITTYNYLQYLKKSEFFNNTRNYKLAISDPGYEEFTTWSLIEDPFNEPRNISLLIEDYRPSINIIMEGQGEIYSIDQIGSSGYREVTFDSDLIIRQSQITNTGKPALVKRSGYLPSKIALTFDDGPHPTRTLQVLDILDKYNVKGTFFVTGNNVLNYPQAAKAIVDRGHEIENHSFSHPVFSLIANTSQISEIEATNEAIKTVTGITPKYFRKPFSNFSGINTDDSINYLMYLNNLNLKASEYDIDSKDWSLDTAEETIAKVVQEIESSDGNFSQILFHDTSEKIDNTLIALPKIIEYLQKNNIEIVRVDQLNDPISELGSKPQKSTTTYKAINSKHKLLTTIMYFNIFVLVTVLIRNAWLISGTIVYNYKLFIRRYFFHSINKSLITYPALSVIIACYNEELVIERTLESLVECNYPKLKIFVVNDGSTDETPNIVKNLAKKHKNIILLNTPKGGKAKALQVAIKKVRTRFIVFCDADTIFEKHSLQNFANSIFLNSQNLGAVAGNIYVGNQINTLTRAQTIEYGIAHMFIKPTQDTYNTITVVPGATGMWSRGGLVKSGGFLHDTLAEDADATMRIISLGKKVRFNSQVITKTEVPDTFQSLFKQRTRWQLGNLQTIYKHRHGIFNIHYGSLGFIGLPMFYLDITLTIIYPFILPFILYTLFLSFSAGYNAVSSNLQLITIIGLLFSTLELLFAITVIIFQRNSLLNKIKLFLTLPYFFTIYKMFLSYSTIVASMRALRGTAHGWNYLVRTATVT